MTSPDEEKWRAGRRLVELGVFADALSACGKCLLPLHLRNIRDESRYGLGQ